MSFPRTNDGALPVGGIRFFDNHLPPLDAGDYVISVQQTVANRVATDPPLSQTFPKSAPLTQFFSILAPRFALDASDIYSVFPPSDSSGAFDQNLPHIVLAKRNLPWERFLVENDKVTPWLALLLFAPDEILAPVTADPTARAVAKVSRAGTYRSSQVLDPPTGTLGPRLIPEKHDVLDQVTALTLSVGGSGYTSAPTVTIQGGGGTNATGTAEIQNGAVVALTVTSGGSGFTSDPDVTFSGGGGTGAAASAQRGVLCRAIDITTGTFTKVTPRFAIGASATDELKYLAHCRLVGTDAKELLDTKDDGWLSLVIGNRFPSAAVGPVTRLTLQEGGANYAMPPAVTIMGGGGAGATAMAQIENGVVTSIVLTNGGGGYSSAPTLQLSGGGGAGAAVTAQIGAPWIAHLVSLEGFSDFLTDAPSWPQGVQRVRLASLFSWSFTCVSEAGDFRDLMTKLTAGQAPGGAGLLLRPPAPPQATPPPAGSAAAVVRAALGDGYTALNYETLVGDQTFAWYRGPLLPAPRPRFVAPAPYANAAAAMIYDASCGLFDHSYSTAWQTGRLLALADADFGAKLMQWRREGNSTVNLLVERTASSGGRALLGASAGAKSDPETMAGLRRLLTPALASRSFMAHLTGDRVKDVASKIAAKRTPPARGAAPTTTPRRGNVVQAIRTVMAHPAVQQLLMEHGAAALQDPDSPLPYIVDWLARLCLLEDVPFVNLVPDARMLPRESLRFFFVDPNYLDALVAGAMSIGVQSSRDLQYQSLLSSTIADAVRSAMPAVRGARTGAPPAPPPSATMSGVLLRSSVVSGWPGLEVRGYKPYDSAQQTPLLPLRLDRVAPDVLLVLFPDTPECVEISEPKESLAFGHEDDDVVDLRWVTNDASAIGATIDGASTTLADVFFRTTDPAPVLNVQSWQAHLATKLGAEYSAKGYTAPANWGPAAFAIQMIRAPEELRLVPNTPATDVGHG